MEIKDGYPINLNLIEKILFKRRNEDVNLGNLCCEWVSSDGEKHKRAIGAALWPLHKSIRRHYFQEGCNLLTGRRLLFIIQSSIRQIPFVASVKIQYGTVLDLIHSCGREETIDVKDKKYDGLLIIRCFDAA